MESQQRKTSVLMFPWLAHGHISPFLELARTLSNRNFNIYLCSTPVNLRCIKKKLAADEKYSESITLVEIQVPVLPDLPPDYHTTKNLPPHLMPTLKKAFDRSAGSFSKLVKTLKPDLLIYDTIQPWAPAIASKHDIPAVTFVSTSATMTSFMLHRHKNSGTEYPFPEIYLNGHEDGNLMHLLQSPENYYKGKCRFFECLERSCGMILIKSSREIEGKHIDRLSLLAGKKIVPVGPLVEANSTNENDDHNIIQWLDKKGFGSTVFVSFGSEYFLTKEEMGEMAHGLELSGVNFIWVVRFPVGKKIRIEEAMPGGFLERVGERGLIIQGWAPQVKILEHPSIGGFVSHCGWSSVMEGIKYGVPIIAVPMHLDQPVNARLLSEIGVGVEVRRDEEGKLVREEVAKVVKEMVVEERGSGEGVRMRERELSEKIRTGEEGLEDGMVEELMLLCRKKRKRQLEVINGLSSCTKWLIKWLRS